MKTKQITFRVFGGVLGKNAKTKDIVSLYDTYCFVLQKILFCPRSDSLLGLFRYHLRLVRISLYPPKGLSPHLEDDTGTGVRRYCDNP